MLMVNSFTYSEIMKFLNVGKYTPTRITLDDWMLLTNVESPVAKCSCLVTAGSEPQSTLYLEHTHDNTGGHEHLSPFFERVLK
jgi:hypothetical protein